MHVEHSAPAEPAPPQTCNRLPGKPLQAWSTPYIKTTKRQNQATANAWIRISLHDIAHIKRSFTIPPYTHHCIYTYRICYTIQLFFILYINPNIQLRFKYLMLNTVEPDSQLQSSRATVLECIPSPPHLNQTNNQLSNPGNEQLNRFTCVEDGIDQQSFRDYPETLLGGEKLGRF